MDRDKEREQEGRELTIRCDGKVIAEGTIGSRDVMYHDREFAAPFIRAMRPHTLDSADVETCKEAGQYLCEASSQLYSELSKVVGNERAAAIVHSLPADAQVVTIRDEGKY